MLTGILKKSIARKKDPFLFEAYNNNINFETIPDPVGLYIHIPFCRSICPFCPYNKEIYSPDKAWDYKRALLGELSLLEKSLSGKNVSSLYIGGGTPTLMLEELDEVFRWLHKNISFNGNSGIEIHPKEASKRKLRLIKDLGINLVSIGVQTFSSKHLRFLGRNYSGSEARKAVEAAKSFNFDCVDVDIMFNIPGQKMEEMEDDLVTCYNYDVEQVSIYPLIVFPMTPLGRKIKQEKLTVFNQFQEHGILKRLEDLSKSRNYEKTSVWTFGKSKAIKYTSITRESFVGVGAGATSLFGNYFYLNTFDVNSYIKRVTERKLPVNLVNKMSTREKMVFWLFWRFYETSIDNDRFYQLFSKNLREEFPVLVRMLLILGLAKMQGNVLQLTSRGAYIYHLIEKYYSVTYLNSMWEECRNTPWLKQYSLE